MENSIQFSVLISLYDKESPINLSKCFDSLICQTLQPTEIILVLDGPINNDLKIIIENAKIQLKNLKIIPLTINEGLGNALRKGTLECSNEIVARMDTDDVCYPTRFEKQIPYIIKQTDLSVLGTTIQEFNKEPGDLGTFRQLPSDKIDLFKFAKYRNPLNHPTVVFRKSHVLAVNSYIHMPLFEDYFLWVRLLVKGYNIENLNESLLHFRVGENMIVRRKGLKYGKNEFRFLLAIKRLGFINFYQLFISICIKVPLRILPKKILIIIYKLFLRNK